MGKTVTSGTDISPLINRNDAGLTLLELLITLVLVALVMGVAVPSLFGGQRRHDTQSIRAALIATLEDAHTRAQRNRNTITLRVVPNGLMGDGRPLFAATSLHTHPPMDAIHFYEDGTTTTVTLDYGAAAKLHLDGLTGRITAEVRR